MRRILMFNHVTADGYFSGSDGNLNWIVPDEEIDRAAVQRTQGIDTILLGRRTYELFEAYWPNALDDSSTAADPHDASRRSSTLRDMAVWINEVKKLVFSRTLKKVAWKNTSVLPKIDPAEIEAMKRKPGRDMIVFGSGSVVSELTRQGLIDEYQFVVNPVLLGSGKRMMESVSKSLKLELIETREYSCGNVVLRYATAPPSGGMPPADRRQR